MSMIQKSKISKLVNKPKGKKVTGVKWVYKTKLNADNSIKNYKSRFAVKGYAQSFSIDYSDTFFSCC